MYADALTTHPPRARISVAGGYVDISTDAGSGIARRDADSGTVFKDRSGRRRG